MRVFLKIHKEEGKEEQQESSQQIVAEITNNTNTGEREEEEEKEGNHRHEKISSPSTPNSISPLTQSTSLVLPSSSLPSLSTSSVVVFSNTKKRPVPLSSTTESEEAESTTKDGQEVETKKSPSSGQNKKRNLKKPPPSPPPSQDQTTAPEPGQSPPRDSSSNIGIHQTQNSATVTADTTTTSSTSTAVDLSAARAGAAAAKKSTKSNDKNGGNNKMVVGDPYHRNRRMTTSSSYWGHDDSDNDYDDDHLIDNEVGENEVTINNNNPTVLPSNADGVDDPAIDDSTDDGNNPAINSSLHVGRDYGGGGRNDDKGVTENVDNHCQLPKPTSYIAENNPESARGDQFSSSLPNHKGSLATKSTGNAVVVSTSAAAARSSSDFDATRGIDSRMLPSTGQYPVTTNSDGVPLSEKTSMPEPHVATLALKAHIDDGCRKKPAISTNCDSCVGSQHKSLDFVSALKMQGLEMQEQEGDGNCLFRAISLQVYGDPSMHGEVRKRCMDFMEQDEEHFSQFVTGEPFKEYIARKRSDGVHGNHTEIQAASELFNRPIEVYTPENGSKPLNIFHAEYKTDDVPIRLSYHDGNHYNAVIDPLVPTAGLGLGLPGLQLGLADKMQMAKAVSESDAVADQMELQRALKSSEEDEIDRVLKSSEDDELQRAIKESQLSNDHILNCCALSSSDADATYFELEQAVLEESLQSFQNNEEGKKRSATTTSAKRKQEVVESAVGAGTRSDALNTDVYQDSDFRASAAAGVASIPFSSTYAAAASASTSATSSSTYAASASASNSSLSRSFDVGSSVLHPVHEYPDCVQELVMNGFPLSSVVKVMEIVGPSFDDMLSLLMANQR